MSNKKELCNNTNYYSAEHITLVYDIGVILTVKVYYIIFIYVKF